MHRDFKPDNIFMNNGFAKIGDFGFAKMVMDDTGTYIGKSFSIKTILSFM